MTTATASPWETSPGRLMCAGAGRLRVARYRIFVQPQAEPLPDVVEPVVLRIGPVSSDAFVDLIWPPGPYSAVRLREAFLTQFHGYQVSGIDFAPLLDDIVEMFP